MDNGLKTSAIVCWVFGWAAVIAQAVDESLHLGFIGIGFFALAATSSLTYLSRDLSRHTRRAVYRQFNDVPCAPGARSNVRQLHG